MTATPIQEAIARLDWAKAHVDSFCSELESYYRLPAYEIVGASCPDPEKPGNSFAQYALKIHHPLPISLRMKASDSVHNLRAIVDGIIWSLGQQVGATERVSLAFLQDDKKYLDFVKSTRFNLFPTDIQTWLEDIQLYRQADTKPTRLQQLNELWNENKHRLPNLLINVQSSIGLGFSGVGGHIDFFANVPHKFPLKDGDPLAIVSIRNNQRDSFRPGFTFSLRFDKIDVDAESFLIEIEKHIRNDVIPRFAPHFT